MAYKKTVLCILFFTITVVSFSESLEFTTIQKTMLYSTTGAGYFTPSRDSLFEIDAGIRVNHVQKPPSLGLFDNREFAVILSCFEYNNKNYFINCADLIPANTIDRFESVFISELNSSNRKTWVPEYYPRVLQSMDINTILLFDSYWKNFDPYRYGSHGERVEWYEIFNDFFPLNTFLVSNSAIVYNKLIGFVIRSITKTSNGYIVNVKINNDESGFWNDDLDWDMIREKEFFNMILLIDGDYMDVYIDDPEHKLTTFVLVEQILLEELQSLGLSGKADLSRVTSWPRRAPKQLNTGEEARVLENLRLRESPNTTAATITTMEQGSKVTILEIGSNAVIDGITAPWIKVQTPDGNIGWCFGLYLREIRLDPSPEDFIIRIENNEEPVPEIAEDESAVEQHKSFPFWVVGIGVLLAGGVLFFVKRRK